MGGIFLASVLVGLSTSLPELFVGITSAFNGIPNLSLGNAIGSNIANLTVVTGGAALIAGTIAIKNNSYAKDLMHAFIAGMAPLYLLMDNSLSRVDALILIVLYFYFNYSLLQKEKYIQHEIRDSYWVQVKRFLHPKKNGKNLTLIFISIAAILFSADMIVKIGIQLAGAMNISTLLVGLFFVAVGTSLPEFAVMIQAIRIKDSALFMGNLLGSIVANATLVVGVTAFIAPITIRAFNDYLYATLAFLLIFFAFYWFIRSKEKVNRFEGGILLVMYGIFTIVEFLK